MTPLLRQVLDAVGFGLVLVDAQGHVLHANATAVQQCRHGAPLVLPASGQPRDSVAAALPAEDAARLHAAIRSAMRGLWAMVALNRGGEAVLAVGVAPIQVDAGDSAAPPPVALLMLGAEVHDRCLARQFFDTEHHLTHHEGKVLDALCDGLTPQQIAGEHRVKISTVRTQIAAVREKVGVDSIRRLIHRVASLPPMAGLGRRLAG
ncbi:helix-turn-helix transcriptional regulator [Aquabacterium sp. OR-4]|uniref:helix-turn-helix transcriptional regulator n=1 Tax=Aquabacterium sp. OR-4 TaxID=2978127 RepID=UPI0028C9BEC4|nr:helix-turn-helix transcriptional regulator [Aquabacterium sp. OR-4]MDT7838873.1 helix-turn-helix transcriptional regulator [Aquabacterium sp. OR-4]